MKFLFTSLYLRVIGLPVNKLHNNICKQNTYEWSSLGYEKLTVSHVEIIL